MLWDIEDSSELGVCFEARQLAEYEVLYYRIRNMDQASLVKETKCSVPCVYNEYTVVETNKSPSKDKVMNLFIQKSENQSLRNKIY